MDFLRKQRQSISIESASSLIRDNPDVYNEMVYVFGKTFFSTKWFWKYVVLLEGNVYIFDSEDSRKYHDKFSLTCYSNVVAFKGKEKSLALRIESRNPKLEKKYFAATNEGNRKKLIEALNTEIENANYSICSDVTNLRNSRALESNELQRRLAVYAPARNSAIPITSTDEFQNTHVNMSGSGNGSESIETHDYATIHDEGSGNGSESIETHDYATIHDEEDMYLSVEGSDAGSQEGDNENTQTLNLPVGKADSNNSAFENNVNGNDSSSASAIVENARSMRRAPEGNIRDGTRTIPKNITASRNEMINAPQNGNIGPKVHTPPLYEGSDDPTDSSISRCGSIETISSDDTTGDKWIPKFIDN